MAQERRASPPEAGAPAARARLPVRPRLARLLVLFAVFVCAACGLVYELALVALGSYLLGDTVVQASVVLSVMVFAMGVGSLLSKRLTDRPAFWFAVIEGMLSVVGGLSVPVLYAAFAWFSLYQPAMVLLASAIGALIGAEIPLLMTLIQRIRRQDAADAAADMFAADYVGGLVGGLAFPFALLPVFGLLKGTLLVGALNAVVGVCVVLWLFRGSLSPRGRLLPAVGLVLVLAVLASSFALSGRFEVSARQALYRDPIVYAQRSDYQEIVVTRKLSGSDTRLFLNGDLQFSSLDEYRYHESLVHPAMNGPHEDVLVLGGGDGLAVRELVGYRDVDSVTLVDLDPAVTRLARSMPAIRDLNEDSLSDARVRVVNADAFTWLRENRRRFDVVVVDMPDPDDTGTAKLYSAEFYGLVRQAVTERGRMAVQAGSPYFAPDAYWSVRAGLRSAGWRAAGYHVDVPSFGDWGFFLAVPEGRGDPAVELPEVHPPLRFLDAATLRAAQTFPKDRRPTGAKPSTLLMPRLLDYERGAWEGY
ncbi:polyamine aminopropyltransferase [Streptomonospora wellingtoniae]|uniref:Polyamine aminopropyltransferase n=1 Tax=Streptomonospora wellingtoniae TaxID=3075544 RepID=A0ABU2KSX1_9ACTN|nr:polyamine aminopropyltransferase [Streptomonospora sp. DSM 45055]MDT0302343.1 polyamine aminopropyltransferase [Streptomonospora sp. DSM 45055]